MCIRDRFRKVVDQQVCRSHTGTRVKGNRGAIQKRLLLLRNALARVGLTVQNPHMQVWKQVPHGDNGSLRQERFEPLLLIPMIGVDIETGSKGNPQDVVAWGRCV